MIPLRDANPTRRRPVVTTAIIVTCFITFAIELGIQASGGEDALSKLFDTFGLVPADLTAALRALATSSEERPQAIVVVSDGRLDDPPEDASRQALEALGLADGLGLGVAVGTFTASSSELMRRFLSIQTRVSGSSAPAAPGTT